MMQYVLRFSKRFLNIQKGQWAHFAVSMAFKQVIDLMHV